MWKYTEVHFPGNLLWVLCAPFPSVLKPDGVCAVNRSSNNPAETAEHPLGHISGWLAALSQSGSQGPHVYLYTPPVQSGFWEEHVVRYNFCGIIPGLSDFHSTPLAGTCGRSWKFLGHVSCSFIWTYLLPFGYSDWWGVSGLMYYTCI